MKFDRIVLKVNKYRLTQSDVCYVILSRWRPSETRKELNEFVKVDG